jgi:hypothetical protein
MATGSQLTLNRNSWPPRHDWLTDWLTDWLVGQAVKLLLVLASTVILGFGSHRDPCQYFSFQDFCMFLNGAFFPTVGRVWLLPVTPLLLIGADTHSLSHSLNSDLRLPISSLRGGVSLLLVTSDWLSCCLRYINSALTSYKMPFPTVPLLLHVDSLLGNHVYRLLPSSGRLFWFSCHHIQHSWFKTKRISHIKLI